MLWFENNYMKLNTDKYHFFFFRTNYEHSWAKKGDDIIWESNEVTLLGMTIDKIKFEIFGNISFKANQELSLFSSLARSLTFD